MHWQRCDKEDQHYSGTYLDKKLKKENLCILDKTKDNGSNRGEGILDWLERHNVESWIVLDDEIFEDYEACGIIPHLVKTSFYKEGLQDEHTEEAIRLLNGKQQIKLK